MRTSSINIRYILAGFVVLSSLILTICVKANLTGRYYTSPSYLSGKHAIELGLGIPVCSFSKGVVNGNECVNFTTRFTWVNASILYQYRASKRFEIGGGIMPAFVSIVGVPAVGAHLVVSGKILIAPDWLYVGVQMIGGFPLLAAYDLFFGHAFQFNRKLSFYIENHLTAMFIGGVFMYWQPMAGVKIHF